MICSSVRQIAALTFLGAALLHLGMGLKLAVFPGTSYGGQALHVVPLVLMGFVLWATGCRLAIAGASAKGVSAERGSVRNFPAPKMKLENNEECSKAAA